MKKRKMLTIRLRLPTSIAFLFLVLYALVIYFAAEESKVSLPAQDVPIRLYSNQAGDDLQKTFTQAILNAKESIVCIIYSLTDETIIAALKKQADDGVKVLVICDPVATQDVGEKLGPHVTLFSRRQKGLMHNKLLAIDHKQCWLGSANFTRESLLLHANIVMGIESTVLAQAIEEKAEGLMAKKSRRMKPLAMQTVDQRLEVSFLPDDTQACHKLMQQIASAKKSVKVAMFTFTHQELVQTLIAAHDRGVAVEVVLDHDSSRQTSRKAFQILKDHKISLFTSHRNGLLHEKMAIIDDEILIMGSANWTKAAFSSNDENLCMLFPLTNEQKEKLQSFWNTTLRESALSFSWQKHSQQDTVAISLKECYV